MQHGVAVAALQASKQAIRQQVSNHAGKHLGGIQSEPCPVGACFY